MRFEGDTQHAMIGLLGCLLRILYGRRLNFPKSSCELESLSFSVSRKVRTTPE
jgi:hypothetical protein